MNSEDHKAKIKKVNLLIHVSEGTDPDIIVSRVERIIQKLEERGIVSKYITHTHGITHGVVVDEDGKAED